MYYDPFLITILICLFLMVLGLLITIHLVDYSRGRQPMRDKEYEPYLDAEGYHSYYERSLIKKSKFHHLNPQIPFQNLRTFRRLLALIMQRFNS